ncbi:MAG: efflux RND transporter periplasmic adaptor subunit [Myxococcota bacterium]|nr:efflux RND transporter periplasmic adaptor subunit [Myxococcota bacterium]
MVAHLELEPAPEHAARPPFQARKRRPVARIVFGIVLVVAAVSFAFSRWLPVAVTTTPITRGTAIDAVYATGTVEPFDRVIVKAKAAGSIDLKVREGMHVKKGELLATVDSPALRYDLARGKADFWAASQQANANAPQLASLEAQARAIAAELNTVNGDRARTARLVESGSVAQTELDRLVDRAAGLRAQLDANSAQRRSLRIDLTARESGSSAAVDTLAARLADAEVRAPMDGVVLTRFVEPGEVAMVNSPLVKIGGVDNLILECSVDEADIGRVTVGKKVVISLYAFPQTIGQGEVFEILPDADRAKKSFVTKVKFVDPPAGLRSGMTAEANVIIDQRPDSLLVPAEAVDSSGAVLLVEGRHVHRRHPTLGVRDMLRVEVIDGLHEGDQVVVSDGAKLKEDARAKATIRPPADGVTPPRGTRSKLSL